MTKFLPAAIAIALACAGAHPANAQRMLQMGAAVGASHSMLHTIKIDPRSDSGESGKATLQQTPDGLVVKVELAGATGEQPAHISKGTCAALDPNPAYALQTLSDGTSTTTIKDVTIYSLMRGTYAINVQKSTDDLKTDVACGDLTLTK